MSFVVPSRKILSQQHVTAFKQSSAYKALTSFVLAVNDAVKGKTTSASHPQNEVHNSVEMID
jgi:hypothetical protein